MKKIKNLLILFVALLMTVSGINLASLTQVQAQEEPGELAIIIPGAEHGDRKSVV